MNTPILLSYPFPLFVRTVSYFGSVWLTSFSVCLTDWHNYLAFSQFQGFWFALLHICLRTGQTPSNLTLEYRPLKLHSIFHLIILLWHISKIIYTFIAKNTKNKHFIKIIPIYKYNTTRLLTSSASLEALPGNICWNVLWNYIYR